VCWICSGNLQLCSCSKINPPHGMCIYYRNPLIFLLQVCVLGHLNSKGLWPPRSPFLSTFYFYIGVFEAHSVFTWPSCTARGTGQHSVYSKTVYQIRYYNSVRLLTIGLVLVCANRNGKSIEQSLIDLPLNMYCPYVGFLSECSV